MNATSRLIAGHAKAFAGILIAWFLVSVMFSLQGYAVSAYRGSPQPWWPSFGYTLSIFSVWALLTPPVLAAIRRVEGRVPRRAGRLAIYLAGLPVVVALHVGLFALLFWPVYNDGGRIASRWAMGERMFVPNLGKNSLLYLILVLLAAGQVAWERRRAAHRAQIAEVQARLARRPPSAVRGAPDGHRPLQVKSKGAVHLIRPDDIEWVGAAGDYSEVHVGGATHLIEESLTSLCKRLPAVQFARVHRSTIVRLDRIAEIRALGRGDALIKLVCGRELRLSRRFRKNLVQALGQ